MIIMKNRYKVSLLVIAILLAFSMTVGTSYAFWTTTVTQEGTNEVVAGCLEIELNDVELDESGNSVSTTYLPISGVKPGFFFLLMNQSVKPPPDGLGPG